MKQKIFLEVGSISNLVNVLKEYSVKRIFLVTGKSSFELSGAKFHLKSIFNRYIIQTFSEFESNPKIDDLIRGCRLFTSFNPDIVLAIGGGSVIDMAKLINFFAHNNFSAQDVINSNKKKTNKGMPLVGIPTTAGTGSEATHFAVLYINGIKYSIAHPFILPDIAIIDPVLTLSAPPKITASTGMDALSQAIESYWNINSTTESKRYAREAIKLSIKNLKPAVLKPNIDTRTAMAKAAYLAGAAINITKTTAPHAISYSFTSYYMIPHGHAVALTLPSFLIYNNNVSTLDLLDVRGVDYVKFTMKEIFHFLNTIDANSAQNIIYKLMNDIGLEWKLRSLGIIEKKDIELIINNGPNPERLKNNPRRLNQEDLHNLLYSLL